MDHAAARALVESALQPGEILLWAEAAPAAPASTVHFVLTLVLIGVVIGGAWATLKAWSIFLPLAMAFTRLISKALSLAALSVATLLMAGIVVLSAFAALINGTKVLTDSSVAYAVTDRQAMFVYNWSGAPYIESLGLDVLRIQRDGDALRFGQPLSAEFFGVLFDPVFYDLEDAAAVETLIRRVARETKQTPAQNIQTRVAPPDAATLAAIAPALYADETVLWAQRAEGRPYMINATLMFAFMGFFGSLLLGCVFWPLLPGDGQSTMATRFIIAPIGAALTLWAISSFGWSAGAGRIYFALTEDRLIVTRTGPWRDTRDFGPWYFDDVRLSGSDVFFCRRSGGRRSSCNNGYLPNVRDAEAVAALMREIYQAHENQNNLEGSPAN